MKNKILLILIISINLLSKDLKELLEKEIEKAKLTKDKSILLFLSNSLNDPKYDKYHTFMVRAMWEIWEEEAGPFILPQLEKRSVLNYSMSYLKMYGEKIKKLKEFEEIVKRSIEIIKSKENGKFSEQPNLLDAIYNIDEDKAILLSIQTLKDEYVPFIYAAIKIIEKEKVQKAYNFLIEKLDSDLFIKYCRPIFMTLDSLNPDWRSEPIVKKKVLKIIKKFEESKNNDYLIFLTHIGMDLSIRYLVEKSLAYNFNEILYSLKGTKDKIVCNFIAEKIKEGDESLQGIALFKLSESICDKKCEVFENSLEFLQPDLQGITIRYMGKNKCSKQLKKIRDFKDSKYLNIKYYYSIACLEAGLDYQMEPIKEIIVNRRNIIDSVSILLVLDDIRRLKIKEAIPLLDERIKERRYDYILQIMETLFELEDPEIEKKILFLIENYGDPELLSYAFEKALELGIEVPDRIIENLKKRNTKISKAFVEWYEFKKNTRYLNKFGIPLVDSLPDNETRKP